MEDMYSAARKRVTTSRFVELEPGKQTKLRILDHPFVSVVKFPDKPESTYFLWPVYNYDLGKPQILKKGPGFFKKIGAIMGSTWGSEMPMKCDLDVTSTGAGLNTRYEVIPAPYGGNMPVVHLNEIKELFEDQKGLVTLADYSNGVDPVVQVVGAESEPTGDTTPTADEVSKFNLDDIPF